MQGQRPGGGALLSLLYAVSAALCVLGAVQPLSSRSPVPLLWTLAAVGAAGAAALWLRRNRLSGRTAQVAVALMSVLMGLLAWQSSTATGVVEISLVMVVLAVFAAHFLSRRAAWAHVALMLAVTSAGALAARPSGFVAPWLTAVLTVAVLTEVQGRIAGELHRAAGTDPLTGVANRRAWEAEAARNLARALRTDEPLTVALIDLDGFKKINDENGHSAGDALLRSLAHEWTAQLRLSDLIGRYGGDEFVLCLPATDARRAGDLLTRLRASHPASWSAGTATARAGDTLADVLQRADAELYLQKGRNRAG
jgi:diguanylate cyclase (GGDEF)-like protein